MSTKGKINIYTCMKCGHDMVTIDRDDGTTPMMTVCPIKGCRGTAYSHWYQVPDPAPMPTHEWHMPPESEWGRNYDHHSRGGLALRPIETEE